MHLPTVYHWIITLRWEIAGTPAPRTVEVSQAPACSVPSRT